METQFWHLHSITNKLGNQSGGINFTKEWKQILLETENGLWAIHSSLSMMAQINAV